MRVAHAMLVGFALAVLVRPATAAECALVATGGFDAVTVVDLESGAVTAQIPARERTIAVAVSPDGRSAYAANHDDNSVSVIDRSEAFRRAWPCTPAGRFSTSVMRLKAASP